MYTNLARNLLINAPGVNIDSPHRPKNTSEKERRLKSGNQQPLCDSPFILHHYRPDNENTNHRKASQLSMVRFR